MSVGEDGVPASTSSSGNARTMLVRSSHACSTCGWQDGPSVWQDRESVEEDKVSVWQDRVSVEQDRESVGQDRVSV